MPKVPEVTKNETNRRLLGRAIKNGRLSHFYIFSGERGSGRKTLALNFAASVLCSGEEKPCGECLSCRKIEKGIHPDISFFGAADSRQIKVETVSEISKNAYIAPGEADFRFIIIYNAELMNEEAQNKLLKLLEEAPAHLIFIFIVEDMSKILETLRSRAVKLCMDKLEPGLIEKLLYENEKIKNDSSAEAADRISVASRLARGSIGRAIAYLTDDGVLKAEEQAKTVLRSYSTKKIYQGMEMYNSMNLKTREELSSMLLALKGLVRDILVFKETNSTDYSEYTGELSFIVNAGRILECKKLIRLNAVIDKMLAALERNCNVKLAGFNIFTKGWECLND